MKIAVMLGGVLLVIVASSWAHGDEPRPGEGLDPAGNPINLTQLSRISDVNTFLSHKSSIGERAQDLSCEALGGVDVAQQCLIFHDEEALSWEEAAAKCYSNGARLASPADPSALIQYKDNKYGGKHFWVGGTDAITQGHWFWLTGKPFGDSFPWSTTPFGDTMEPNNYGGNEHCVMTWNGNGYNDATCIKRLPYICVLENTNPEPLTCPPTCPTCPDWVYKGSSLGCIKVGTNKMNSWDSARAYCKGLGRGSDLLILDTEVKRIEIANSDEIKAYTNLAYWIGGNDRTDDTWKWINGNDVSLPSGLVNGKWSLSNGWWGGQPNEDKGHDNTCLHIVNFGNANVLRDDHCTQNQYFALCQINGN